MHEEPQLTLEQQNRVHAMQLMGRWFAGFISRQAKRMVAEIANDK